MARGNLDEEPTMKKIELLDHVEDGRLDSILDELANAVRERRRTLYDRERRALEQAAKKAFKEDSRVEISGGIRPKYLLGATGTITGPPTVGKRGALYFPVRLDYPIRRYGYSVTAPASCLTASDTPAPSKIGATL
jgi:hypothetical protein